MQLCAVYVADVRVPQRGAGGALLVVGVDPRVPLLVVVLLELVDKIGEGALPRAVASIGQTALLDLRQSIHVPFERIPITSTSIGCLVEKYNKLRGEKSHVT